MGSSELYFSTGRGGAGNIAHGDKSPLPQEVEEGSIVPTISQEIYTTGRGGAGNMRKNKDAKLTRELQDVDPTPQDFAATTKPNFGSHASGRGGYGNVIAAREQAEKEKKNFMDKVKDMFK